jgi:hypothetical protein
MLTLGVGKGAGEAKGKLLWKWLDLALLSLL